MKRLSGVPTGFEPFVLKKLLRKKNTLLYVVPSEAKLAFITSILPTVTPDISFLTLPTWDTVPYDRTAPAAEIIGQRLETLSRIGLDPNAVPLVITTASALLQRIPPPSFFRDSTRRCAVGQSLSFDELKAFLIRNGYHATDMVMEVGDFAVRGGIIDVFPTGASHPVRIDFFGDDIDSIKTFDVITQRSLTSKTDIVLKPVSEFLLTPDSIALFRSRHRELFDTQSGDSFYEAVSDGRYVQGLEHFLPLFHEHLVSLLDYIPDAEIVFDFQTADALQSRRSQIEEYYEARRQALKEGGYGSLYQPVPPDLFFLSSSEIDRFLNSPKSYSFSPFVAADGEDMGGRLGRDFSDMRAQNKTDIFEVVADFIHAESRKVILTASTFGASQRLAGLLRDRGCPLAEAETFAMALKKAPAILTAPFETGFKTDQFIVITETDILGDRIIRPTKKKKTQDFLTDLTTLNIGDMVVHQIYGIGRFMGLVPLQIDCAAHDCLCLMYEGDDKLFVPVENMDMLSRYGSADKVALDRLGSTAFTARKERVKKDLFRMAEQLMSVASARAVKQTERILAPHGLYQEFCAHFPYAETDDQTRTISEIESDLAGGHPMDRLVCGDVGFGKTEVAMRAAFLAVMAGYQVAVIVPTTLLARQHTQNFIERFHGFPVRIGSLSRLISGARAHKVHQELQSGTMDIVIGTHALLAKGVAFKNLGLVIIDEEQHFGVAHKERLKELKQGVHVLTLTATPIPRTLQLSLAGVRSLSVIATPPVDRLAVKTFVMPFDPVIVKEALLREHFRGGQSFVVCPRISDMPEVIDILSKIVPDLRVVQAHGQMPATKLEDIMTAFVDKKYDVLVATSIIESGLDMPAVNTMIVYRADMFGLAALYQLRGRVGRGKLRAYAYLTTPSDRSLTETAQKRLTVMQSLDNLGAGFALASHDLDIRGAGNLLGQEQSGHIREVGVALYQKMLGDAIRALRRSGTTAKTDEVEDYSPQISIGLPVLIPDTYIADLNVRMELYRRIGDITEQSEVDSLRAELTDRFGAYPPEVENLLQTVELKLLAKRVHVERLEAGPKGASLSFYHNVFPNPAGLIAYIESQMGTIRIRPDQKLLVMRPWGAPADRLKGVRQIIGKLAELV